MSEYQYYEFRAVDKPLDQKQQAAVRELSTRAEITATSFVNEYHFGDFRGDPNKLMEKYYDAHLYFANWGSRRLMLRVPAAWLALADVQPYCIEDRVTAWQKRDAVVIDLNCYYDDPPDDEAWVDNDALDDLLPLRAELGAGDLRGLYLGWLMGIHTAWHDDIAEDAVEPPVPPGLRQLTAAQRALCKFLQIDADLLEVAAEASADLAGRGPQQEDPRAWVASLPATDKDAVILDLLAGEGATLEMTLQRRFRDWSAARRGKQPAADAGPPRRRVLDLLDAAEHREEENRRRAAEKKAKEEAARAKKKAAERAKYLDDLAPRAAEVWRQVEALIESKKPKEYDEAVRLLVDLRDLAERSGQTAEAAQRFRELRDRHGGKPSLMKRLNQAKLPG